MSNYLAIATVTATLKRILEQEVGFEVPGARIIAQPPDTIDSPPPDALTLFLYQVTLNSGYANFDLPTRNSDGFLISKPILGLNLHYLITTFGSGNNDLQAHKILASAMRVLNENPVLTRDIINDTITAQPGLGGSDLASQVEMIKLTFQPLSIEEITKLWSSFFQTRYRISVCYQATVVLLESKKKPKPALPVSERAVFIIPFKRPQIERIEPQIIQLTDSAEIKIIGHNLKSENVIVKIGEMEQSPQIEKIMDEKILVLVPSTLTAGIKPVQVIHNLRLGSNLSLSKVFKSNVVPFILAPKITRVVTPSIPEGSNLTIDVKPDLAPSQKVELLIGDYIISVPPLTVSVSTISAKIPDDFLQEGQDRGTFLLRIRVDDVESLLEKDNNNRYIAPVVEVTAS